MMIIPKKFKSKKAVNNTSKNRNAPEAIRQSIASDGIPQGTLEHVDEVVQGENCRVVGVFQVVEGVSLHAEV